MKSPSAQSSGPRLGGGGTKVRYPSKRRAPARRSMPRCGLRTDGQPCTMGPSLNSSVGQRVARPLPESSPAGGTGRFGNPYKANGTRIKFETSERDDILDRLMEYRHGPPEDTFLRDTGPRSRPTLEASRADRHAGRETCQRPGGRHGSTKRKALQGQVSGREGISDQPPCPPWSRYQLPGGYWLSGTGTDRAAACRLICYSGNRNCPDCLGKLALQQIAQHARCLQPRLAPNLSNPRRSQPFKEVSQVGRFARGRQGGPPAPRTILRAR